MTLRELFAHKVKERLDEFLSRVRPEHRALAERKERIKPGEVPERMNSYEQRVLVPNYDNEALAAFTEQCLAQVRELGRLEIPKHYNDALARMLAPLLVVRLRELMKENADLRKRVGGLLDELHLAGSAEDVDVW